MDSFTSLTSNRNAREGLQRVVGSLISSSQRQVVETKPVAQATQVFPINGRVGLRYRLNDTGRKLAEAKRPYRIALVKEPASLVLPREVLQNAVDGWIVEELEDADVLLRLMSTGSAPDVLVMDLGELPLQRISRVRRLKAIVPGMGIIVLAGQADANQMLAFLLAGACG